MKKIGLLFILLFSVVAAWSQSRQIKGKIIDKVSGSPLPDVSVLIKGTSLGTLTDKNGNFVLSTNGTGKVDLEVSLISYGTQQITVDGTGDVTINMDKEAKSMDEVVVVG